MRIAAALAAAAFLIAPAAHAWDSASGNPTHPTHSYLTEWGIEQAGNAELRKFARTIVEGANTELHELPVKGTSYGLDLNAKRIEHKGTNAGSDDVPGWWRESLAAYRAGNKERAYFLLGIVLHMIEDMGVPAHANGVYHQGTLKEFDNFELLALQNWKPDFAAVSKADPTYADPSAYYAFSQAWAHEDAPDYTDRDEFSKTWLTASRAERTLLRDREARTATVVKWALQSAAKAFAAK